MSPCWRGYELPTGRPPESFAYRIDEVWDGSVTDTLYTDEKAEADRLIKAMLDQQYDVRVTEHGVTRLIRR